MKIRRDAVIAIMLAMSTLLSGCTSIADPVALKPNAYNITVADKYSNRPAGLFSLGPVSAIHGDIQIGIQKVGNYEGAVNILKNSAAEMGATYIKIIEEKRELDDYYYLRGEAYKPSER
jgi:hypothetical protein